MNKELNQQFYKRYFLFFNQTVSSIWCHIVIEKNILKFQYQYFAHCLKNIIAAKILILLFIPIYLFGQTEFKQEIDNDGEIIIIYKDGYKITKKDFDKSENLVDLATEHWKNDDIETAIKEVEEALSLNNKNYRAWSRKGTLQIEFTSAISCFNQALMLNPNYYIALHNRGCYLYEAERYKEAIEDFDKVLGIDANYTASYYFRGKAKSALKDSQGAIRDFTTVISLDLLYIDAYEARGDEYLNELKFDSMHIDNFMCYKLNYPLLTKGNELCKKGDFDGAIAKYNESIVSEEQPEGALILMGITHFQMGDQMLSLQDFGKAQKLFREKELIGFLPPIIRMDYSEEAIAEYSKEIEKDPKDYFNWERRAEIKKEQGDVNGAIQDYTEAFRLKPNYIELLLSRGDLYTQIGEFNFAIADFKLAIELSPNVDNRQKWMLLSHAQLLKGEKTTSFESYFEAVRFAPKMVDAWLLEAVTFYLRSKSTFALNALNKYESQTGIKDPDLLFIKAWMLQVSDPTTALKCINLSIEEEYMFKGAKIYLLNKLTKK
jgi:tetratricopeptide (TPR) repeat protein